MINIVERVMIVIWGLEGDMRGMIVGLSAIFLCLGCSFSPAETQCRKELELSSKPLQAKAIAACIEKVRALKETEPSKALCLAQCVKKASDRTALTVCSNRCPVTLSRR